MISASEACALILKQARSFGVEKIPLAKSFGRVLAQDVRADRDYPPFNRSAMDGFAIVTDNFLPQKTHRVAKTIFAGDTPPSASPGYLKEHGGGVVETKIAVKIMTGAAVPKKFDAVIRKEDATVEQETVQFNCDSVSLWQNISRQGEDLKRHENLPLWGRWIDSPTASLLASLGIVRPQVSKLPRVTIISTGNEIILPEKKPKLTQIRNANVTALRSQFSMYGITDIAATHVPDNKKKLRQVIADHGACDVLLLTGGVSVGDSDYVPDVLAALKYRKIFHKVKIKPGKPLWFGIRGKTVVFAIPGNPFSCQVIFKIFIEPYLRACFGLDTAVLRLPLVDERLKKDSMENYFPVKLESANKALSALSTIPFNGSGDVKAALFSDGIAVQPAEVYELSSGTVVDFYPWRIL